MPTPIYGLLKNLIYSLEPLKNLNKPFLSSPEFWGSVIASLVALSIAVDRARWLKRLLGIKPELEVVAFRQYRQRVNYWRLAIKNSGKEIARRVQVDVTGIIDNGVKREDYLAIPLRWTHLDSMTRDILPGQTVYLDVIEHSSSGSDAKVKLTTRWGGGVDRFESLETGRSKLTLTFYEASGTTFNKVIEISWPTGMFLDGRLQGKRWALTTNGNFIN